MSRAWRGGDPTRDKSGAIGCRRDQIGVAVGNGGRDRRRRLGDRDSCRRGGFGGRCPMRHDHQGHRGGNADWSEHKSAATPAGATDLRLPCPSREGSAKTPCFAEHPGRVGATGRTPVQMGAEHTVRFAAQRGDIRDKNSMPSIGTGHDRYSSTNFEWCASMRCRMVRRALNKLARTVTGFMPSRTPISGALSPWMSASSKTSRCRAGSSSK